MAKPPRISGVDSALEDLINLETERLRKEDEERRARQEEERRLAEQQEMKRKQDEEERRRREEETRVAREKAEREEMERKERERVMDEMRLRKELEIQQRLEEERLRLKHEAELKKIETSHKKTLPAWAIVLAVVLFAGGAATAGVVLYRMKRAADLSEKERLALIKAAEQEEKAREAEIAKLQDLLIGLEKKMDKSEDELAKQDELKAEIARLEGLRTEAGKGGGKPGKKQGGAKEAKEGEGGDDFAITDDPLANIEKDLGGPAKSKKKKKKVKTVNTNGPAKDLDDPLEFL